MNAIRQGTVFDEFERPVPGATVYIFHNDGTTAAVTADAAGIIPLAQPVETDEFGGYTYYAPDGFYTEEFWYGAKLRFREHGVPVGTSEATLSDAVDDAEASQVAAAASAAAASTSKNAAAASEAAAALSAAQAGASRDLAAASATGALGSYNGVIAALAGVSLATATIPVATRAALAALDHSLGLAAFLMEPGREGMWVFDSTNLAAKVTADPTQGLYQPPTGQNGSGGAWVRHPGIDTWVHAGWFGAKGDNATDDAAAINQALVTANALGLGGVVLKPGLTYRATATLTAKSNVRLFGPNATVNSSANVVYADATGTTGHSVDGVSFVLNTGNGANYLFDISGTNFKLLHTKWTKNPSANGVIGYLRQTSSGGVIEDFTTGGSNGVFVQGHDHRIDGFDLTITGGDDAWVLKAPSGPTYNIEISNGFVRNAGDAIAFGSEIGTAGANDATHANYVRNVTVTNVIAVACTQFAYFKGGAIDIYDYRDGATADITFNSCQLVDLLGTVARRFAYFSCARGHQVSNIRFNNCVGRYRTPNRSAGTNAAVWILLGDYAGGTGAATLDGIYFNGLTIVDPGGGISAGGAAPAGPIDHLLAIERTNTALGTVAQLGRVEFNGVKLDGCARSAVSVNSNLTGSTGPVKLNRATLKNFAAGSLGSADNGAFNIRALKLEVRGLESNPSPGAPAGTRTTIADGTSDATIEIVDVDGGNPIYIGDLGAAAAVHRSFVAQRDLWVRKIEFVNRAAIAANAVDKVTVTVDNKDTGANLATKDSNTGFAVAANTPVSVAGANQFTGPNAFLSKGKTLDITVATAGAAVLAGSTLIVHVVRTGQA
jgi:hypothetical protein